jgi:hypothetical protein
MAVSALRKNLCRKQNTRVLLQRYHCTNLQEGNGNSAKLQRNYTAVPNIQNFRKKNIEQNDNRNQRKINRTICTQTRKVNNVSNFWDTTFDWDDSDDIKRGLLVREEKVFRKLGIPTDLRKAKGVYEEYTLQ